MIWTAIIVCLLVQFILIIDLHRKVDELLGY